MSIITFVTAFFNIYKHPSNSETITKKFDRFKEIAITGIQICIYTEPDFIDTINELIKEFPNVEFIKVDDTIDDWQQMLIMSCCRDNIIANISYSWWGSFFNKNENKIVCYPCQWFGPNLNHDTIDLYPSTWKKIYF